jgi:hypothetical protein
VLGRFPYAGACLTHGLRGPAYETFTEAVAPDYPRRRSNADVRLSVAAVGKLG